MRILAIDTSAMMSSIKKRLQWSVFSGERKPLSALQYFLSADEAASAASVGER